MTSRKTLFNTQTMWLAAVDAMCLAGAVIIGVEVYDRLGNIGVLRRWLMAGFGIWMDPLVETSLLDYVSRHVGGLVYFCGSIILANYVVGSYGVRITTSRFNLLVNWLFSLIVALVVLSITSYAWFEQLLGRGVLALSIVTYALLSLATKGLLYGVVFRSGPFVRRAALLGLGKRAREARETIESRNILPSHRVTAYVRVPNGAPVREDNTLDDVAVVDASIETLPGVIESLGVHLVIVCLEDQHVAAKYYPALRRLRFSGIEIIDALSAAEIYSHRVPLNLVDDAWLLQASMEPSLAVMSRSKRMFDILTSIVGGVICLPLGVLVYLLIKLTAPSAPAIFIQERVGRFGEVFKMYKFRTMVEGAEDDVGAVWSGKDDARITRLGRVLRRFRLDEIPQLVNILGGEMSIVGPRPERPEMVTGLEEEIPYYRERENVLPGLTGWAQVQYPYTDSVEDTAHKLEFDLYYIKNLSLSLDLQVVLRTIRIIAFGKERTV